MRSPSPSLSILLLAAIVRWVVLPARALLVSPPTLHRHSRTTTHFPTADYFPKQLLVRLPSLRLSMSMSTGIISTGSAASAVRIRVINYNVLSSHLAAPTHFTRCDPEHLDAANRLPKVMAQIDAALLSAKTSTENKKKDNHHADDYCCCCLQEVSQSWAGPLHAFFASRGYRMVTGLYGKRFNGYMGVALAYPDALEAVDVSVETLADTACPFEGGWPRPPPEEARGLGERLRTSLFGRLLWKPLTKLLSGKTKTTTDPWELSESRKNVLLFCRLRLPSSTSTVCVSTYHMPCAFYAPMAMNLHAEMALRRVQTLARRTSDKVDDQDPYVLAGDFNILPNSAHYRLLTTGDLELDDPTYPSPRYGHEWTPRIDPVRSAYAETSQGEPDFTNYAFSGEDTPDREPFIETLDYVFLSKQWTVAGCKATKPRDQVSDGPFPNADEPSDHILTWVDLDLDVALKETQTAQT